MLVDALVMGLVLASPLLRWCVCCVVGQWRWLALVRSSLVIACVFMLGRRTSSYTACLCGLLCRRHVRTGEAPPPRVPQWLVLTASCEDERGPATPRASVVSVDCVM